MDVKWGEGAFMGTLEEARKLGETMVTIAKLAGREAVALLSDMNQPLGQMVGNALRCGRLSRRCKGAVRKIFVSTA
jgi:thymidine phosphorylase